LNLAEVFELKPLLNVRGLLFLFSANPLPSIQKGSDVLSLIGKPAGPWLSQLMEQQIEWQLSNPHLGVEDCKKHLISHESDTPQTRHKDKKACKDHE
jgi:hypothetical protein